MFPARTPGNKVFGWCFIYCSMYWFWKSKTFCTIFFLIQKYSVLSFFVYKFWNVGKPKPISFCVCQSRQKFAFSGAWLQNIVGVLPRKWKKKGFWFDTLLILENKRLDQPTVTYNVFPSKNESAASNIAETEDTVWISFPYTTFLIQLCCEI